MVCPRCIMAVEQILHDLNISYSYMKLGEVKLGTPLSEKQREELTQHLAEKGFELLESESSALIAQIKSLIIQQIHHEKKELKVNFSVYLAEEIKQPYGYLSRLFSNVEGITIERFIARQKIERIKELLFYNEMNLSEIAFEMNYSSVAYLSAQFKKETGMTVSQFKNGRFSFQSIDAI